MGIFDDIFFFNDVILKGRLLIIKILTAILFLIVVIPDRTLLMPVALYLLAGIMGIGTYYGGALGLIVTLGAIFFLLFSNFIKINSKIDAWISLICIIIFYFPIVKKFGLVFDYNAPASYFTFSIFIIISSIALIILIKDLVKGKDSNKIIGGA